MLPYLAAGLPRFTSPAARLRLLTLQCALQANTRGQVRLPSGLLRGMRLHGRPELTHAHWLLLPHPKGMPVEVHLLTGRGGTGQAPVAVHAALPHTPPPRSTTTPTWTSSPVCAGTPPPDRRVARPAGDDHPHPDRPAPPPHRRRPVAAPPRMPSNPLCTTPRAAACAPALSSARAKDITQEKQHTSLIRTISVRGCSQQ